MNKSETIGHLSLALSKLQSEVPNVPKDAKAYGYWYAELSRVLEITRPLCAKYELAVTQLCGTDAAGVSVETVLLHSSGEWLSSTLVLPVTVGKGMSQAQAVGSCISYGRRYALTALLGIAQVDNDAAVVVAPAPAPAVVVAPEDKQEQITSSLQNNLLNKNATLSRLQWLVEDRKLHSSIAGWLEHFKVKTFADLSERDLQKLIKSIEEKV